MADKFFDFLDSEQREELDYGRVVTFLRPFLEGAINGTPLTARDLGKGKGAPDYIMEERDIATLTHIVVYCIRDSIVYIL